MANRADPKLPLAACAVMVGFGIIVGMTKPICIMALAALLAPCAAAAERFVAPPVAMPDCADTDAYQSGSRHGRQKWRSKTVPRPNEDKQK